MPPASSTAPVLCYFEKQDASLCGQHLLNNLLQGAYFQVGDLADIAKELDMQEYSLGMRAGLDRGESQNVDESGNFSLQVLETALDRMFSLQLTRETTEALKVVESGRDVKNMEQVAFVFNFHSHWYCARWLHNDFYVLNSLEDGPQLMSRTMLGMYVSQMKTEGWSVFAVTGGMLPDSSNQDQTGPNWRPLFANSTTAKPKPQAFQGKAYSLRSQEEEEDMDPELSKALRMSLAEFDSAVEAKFAQPLHDEPDATSKDVVTVQLILPPAGKRVRRRFPRAASVAQLFAWASTFPEVNATLFTIQRQEDKQEIKLSHDMQLMESIGSASLRVINQS